MRRINSRSFLRHLFGLASAAALSVTLLIPLVCSYSFQGTIGFIWKISGSPTGGQRGVAIGNRSGELSVSFLDAPGGPFTFSSVVRRRGSFFWWTMPGGVRWNYFRKSLLDVGYDHSTTGARGKTDTQVYCPAWMLIVLCGIAPSLWLRRYLRQRAEHDQRGFAVEPSNKA